MTHELKTVNPYFMEVFCGLKSFEVRFNDRDFKEGDILLLKEFFLGEFTGNEVYAEIIYILPGGQFGIKKGYVVMGIMVHEVIRAAKAGKEEQP